MKILKKTSPSFWKKLFKEFFQRTLLLFIAFYRCHLSGFFGGSCRFIPSCSCYAEEALQNLPLRKACFCIFKRLIRCRPLGAFGYDPVEKSK